MMASGAASLGSAGLRVQISSKRCTMCTPSRLPAPPAHFGQRRSSCKAGADHQARWAGAWGGEGSELQVLEWWEDDVDLRRSRAWRHLGERERRWRGAGGAGRVPATGGAGGLVGPVGGGGDGHGTALVCLPAPGGAGAAVAGTVGGGRVRAEGGMGSPVGPVGGVGGGHGAAVARVTAPGGAGAAGAGPGGSWWRLGERERRE